jgi:hypothetical protein
MGRGGSASEVDANLTLVAARRGDVRGLALEDVLPVKLSSRQETSLLALAALMREMPDAPGFESYDICEARDRVRPPGSEADTGLSLNNAGAITAGLVRKGLVEKTESVRKGASGEVTSGEHGWRLTTAGLQLAEAQASVVVIGD